MLFWVILYVELVDLFCGVLWMVVIVCGVVLVFGL